MTRSTLDAQTACPDVGVLISGSAEAHGIELTKEELLRRH
jgi:hypothetical protein